MKHLFLPYNLALIAKEKGFDEPCLGLFENEELNYDGEEKCFPFNNSLTRGAVDSTFVAAPLYQQIIDWFREKHNIIIEVTAYYNPQRLDKQVFEWALSHEGNDFEGLIQNASNRISVDWTTNPKKYKIYEDYYAALTKAIEEAVKLI